MRGWDGDPSAAAAAVVVVGIGGGGGAVLKLRGFIVRGVRIVSPAGCA